MNSIGVIATSLVWTERKGDARIVADAHGDSALRRSSLGFWEMLSCKEVLRREEERLEGLISLYSRSTREEGVLFLPFFFFLAVGSLGRFGF